MENKWILCRMFFQFASWPSWHIGSNRGHFNGNWLNSWTLQEWAFIHLQVWIILAITFLKEKFREYVSCHPRESHQRSPKWNFTRYKNIPVLFRSPVMTDDLSVLHCSAYWTSHTDSQLTLIYSMVTFCANSFCNFFYKW